ncbi:MAG: PH domain-containing protein [Leuconostoc fallax]
MDIPTNAQALPKRVKRVWVLKQLIIMLVIIICLVAAWYFAIKSMPNFWQRWFQIVGGVAVVISVIPMILIPYRYAFNRYLMAAESVDIYQGFLFRKAELIPLNRIQNVRITQGPISRLFHLNNLTIVTAAHNFSINYIDNHTAQNLRQRLINAALQAREVAEDE